MLRVHNRKRLRDLDAAFDACDIRSGATLSFHHHLRNGDAVVAQVLEVATRRGLTDLGLAISSIFPIHAPLADAIRSGVVTRLWTSYAKGPVADALSAGALRGEVVFQSHGGRARAITQGELPIDVAFIAAPVAAADGALTGAIGRAACGPLGYPMVDAAHARRVVAVVESIASAVRGKAEIPADQVDFLVAVDRVGDPAGILSGSTMAATDAESLRIARQAARCVAACGLIDDGFSFQTGAGGISLATAQALGEAVARSGRTGGFISGGIGPVHVALAKERLFRELLDVQSFHPEAAASYARHPWHKAISAAEYASPAHPAPVVDRLSTVILGAVEIDTAFNVNVTTGGDGRIIGGPGGHPDTAAGARLSIVTSRLTGGGYAKVVDRVRTVTTPGAAIDVLVTEAGIAVNPARPEVTDQLRHARLPVVPIETLLQRAQVAATRPPRGSAEEPIGRVDTRHGGPLDTLYRATAWPADHIS